MADKKKSNAPKPSGFDKGVLDWYRGSRGLSQNKFNKIINPIKTNRDFTGFRRGSR